MVSFSSYKLPKTVTVTTLLLFGSVMLLCGTFLFLELSEGPVQSSDCMTRPPYAQLAHPFTLVLFPSTAPLILLISDEFHLQKLLKCNIDKMLNFILKIKVCIEPWIKNRDSNQIVSLVYCYSPTGHIGT